MDIEAYQAAMTNNLEELGIKDVSSYLKAISQWYESEATPIDANKGMSSILEIARTHGLDPSNELAFSKMSTNIAKKHQETITGMTAIYKNLNLKVDALFLGLCLFGGILLVGIILL